MESANTLGLIAGSLTTAAFFPQVLKTWKSRSAKDISFGMFSLFSAGVLLWIIYGFSIGATPVIVANSITFVLAMAIVVFKIRFKD
jgi:MtN3 and saliva related transmembrane protein